MSLSNLLIGILLIRYTSSEDYGLYVTGFATVLFVAGVQNALIIIPVTVRSGAFDIEQKRLYLRWNGSIQNAALVLASLAVVVVWLVFLIAANGWRYHYIVLPVTIASLGWAWREYCRTDALARRDYQFLLRLDLVYVSMLSVLITLSWVFDAFTAAHFLVYIGLAGIVSSKSSKKSRWRITTNLKRMVRGFIYWWRKGRWSLLSEKVSWVQSQSYIYILGSVVGLASVARVSAARLFFAPMQTLLVAWVSYVLPILSRQVADSDWLGFRRNLWLGSAVFLGFTVIWLGAIYLSEDWISAMLLKGKYPDLHSLIVLWSIAFYATALRTVWLAGLRAFGNYKMQFRGSVIGAVTAIAIMVVGLPIFGEQAAVVALAVSDFVVSGIQYKAVSKAMTIIEGEV